MNNQKLYEWCRIKKEDLPKHPGRRVPLRLVTDSAEMGEVMARDFIEEIERAGKEGGVFRAIVPCGPNCWYEPFVRQVNLRRLSLRLMVVFHMDVCLEWLGRELPETHPYNFAAFMKKHFYEGIDPELEVLPENRVFLSPKNMYEVADRIAEVPIDYTLGGWGQDGHIAYNQSRREPYSQVGLDELRSATVRIQYNNPDTVIALAHRVLGVAYQFAPPMSVTLGVKECLSAKKVRLYSDTGAWKQTALRVALFSEPTPEYPITLLQEHPDALLTATEETAEHPISLHPEWDFPGVSK